MNRRRLFLLLETVPLPSRSHTQYLGVLRTKAKRSGRDADHSPPSSGKVKNAWIYTFTASLPLCLQDVHSDEFTFAYSMAVPVSVSVNLLNLSHTLRLTPSAFVAL